jgi:hypothetical protein
VKWDRLQYERRKQKKPAAFSIGKLPIEGPEQERKLQRRHAQNLVEIQRIKKDVNPFVEVVEAFYLSQLIRDTNVRKDVEESGKVKQAEQIKPAREEDLVWPPVRPWTALPSQNDLNLAVESASKFLQMRVDVYGDNSAPLVRVQRCYQETLQKLSGGKTTPTSVKIAALEEAAATILSQKWAAPRLTAEAVINEVGKRVHRLDARRNTFQPMEIRWIVSSILSDEESWAAIGLTIATHPPKLSEKKLHQCTRAANQQPKLADAALLCDAAPQLLSGLVRVRKPLTVFQICDWLVETLYTLGLLRSREESEAALYLPQKDSAEDEEFHSKDGRTESFDTPAQIDKLSLQSKRTSKTVEHHHELEHHHHAQHGARPVKARGTVDHQFAAIEQRAIESAGIFKAFGANMEEAIKRDFHQRHGKAQHMQEKEEESKKKVRLSIWHWPNVAGLLEHIHATEVEKEKQERQARMAKLNRPSSAHR